MAAREGRGRDWHVFVYNSERRKYISPTILGQMTSENWDSKVKPGWAWGEGRWRGEHSAPLTEGRS